MNADNLTVDITVDALDPHTFDLFTSGRVEICPLCGGISTNESKLVNFDPLEGVGGNVTVPIAPMLRSACGHCGEIVFHGA
jgi:hypothetical protein